MTDNGHAEHPARPSVVLEFPGPGLADCEVRWSDDVTSGQLYAAAFVLDAVAREYRAAEASNARLGVKVSPAVLFDALRQAGVEIPGMPGAESKP